MQEALNEADSGRIRLTVGISDSLPKLSPTACWKRR
jgi:LysR family transcriptional activator of nhaA